MEDKVLTTIRKQIKKDARTLSIDNFYLVKVTDAIRAEIEGHASEIRNLSLSGCKLNSLHNFPSLPNLRRLDLNDNNLKDEDLDTLKDLSNLKYLSLAGNKIKTIDAIKKISGNKQLKMIDMFGCPLSKSVCALIVCGKPEETTTAPLSKQHVCAPKRRRQPIT